MLFLQMQDPYSVRHSPRGIFCTRTLNLRSISVIGYDMDYTLIHYNVKAWEGRAYDYGMENLKSMGFPVDDLQFDPDLVIRGLIIDKEKGNLVKADRFGYIKRAMHVSVFFILFQAVYRALFRAHVEGQLKSEIMAEPERFVEPDPELPLALLDQKEIDALVKSYAQKEELVTLIQQKEIVGDLFNQLRLALQRRTNSRPAQTLAASCMDDQDLTESMQKLLIVMQRLDEKIGPMLESDGELFNKRYEPLPGPYAAIR
ncbi:hypothetical protein PR202_ga23845 [Eleusine coracana subsp. coracana]|uniref:5'-nucleotidase n=1 Tax=Eleusine coracana subsp. coracana TaxID=191504 RepID=A0AAV5D7W7_ELECO|nr:hypothetical protein PR202_ga23845 [Eleusine coracana subsp. coracana]